MPQYFFFTPNPGSVPEQFKSKKTESKGEKEDIGVKIFSFERHRLHDPSREHSNREDVGSSDELLPVDRSSKTISLRDGWNFMWSIKFCLVPNHFPTVVQDQDISAKNILFLLFKSFLPFFFLFFFSVWVPRALSRIFFSLIISEVFIGPE